MTNLKHGIRYVTKEEDYPVYHAYANDLPITAKEKRILKLSEKFRYKAQKILIRIYDAQDKEEDLVE